MHSNVVLSGECTYVCVGFSKPQKDRERERCGIYVLICVHLSGKECGIECLSSKA